MFISIYLLLLSLRCFLKFSKTILLQGVSGKLAARVPSQEGGKQTYPLLFGVFGLRALGCLGFYGLTKW